MMATSTSLCRYLKASTLELSSTRFAQGKYLPVVSRCRYGWTSESRKEKKERVVILGSGWAGYALARSLSPKKYECIVISPRGYFVFTPLLAGTAVGTLEFRAILEPVRRAGVKFYQGWADDVDFRHGYKTVRIEANATDDMVGRTVVHPALSKQKAEGSGLDQPQKAVKGEMFDVHYDKLVIAVGAYSQTFGIEGVTEHAHFLRDIGDARRIRLRVLSLFEQCSYPSANTDDVVAAPTPGRATPLSEADKRKLLHFAIVGGGPTGIEFAAELHDLIHEDLVKLYPELIPLVRITVYDVAPKVLPMFDEALAKYAMDTFARQGIEVKTQHHLQRLQLDDGYLGAVHGALKIKIKEYGDEEVGAGMVVWSTGLMQNPLVEKLVGKGFIPTTQETGPEIHHLLKDKKTGGIVIDPYLRARITKSEITTDPDGTNAILGDVYVIGDCAVSENDRTLPKTAQVASQQAAHLAARLNAGDVTEKPFKFRNWGTLTYLGNWKAIHQSKADELRGWVAWILWRGAYLTRSMSWRNKILVPVHWILTWVFGRGISRF